jgi:hypothetical protein
MGFFQVTVSLFALLMFLGFIVNCFKSSDDLFDTRKETVFDKLLNCFIPPYDMIKLLFVIGIGMIGFVLTSMIGF